MNVCAICLCQVQPLVVRLCGDGACQGKEGIVVTSWHLQAAVEARQLTKYNYVDISQPTISTRSYYSLYIICWFRSWTLCIFCQFYAQKGITKKMLGKCAIQKLSAPVVYILYNNLLPLSPCVYSYFRLHQLQLEKTISAYPRRIILIRHGEVSK